MLQTGTHVVERGTIHVKLGVLFLPQSQLSIARVVMGHVLFSP